MAPKTNIPISPAMALARLREIASLKDGWRDGEGLATRSQCVKAATRLVGVLSGQKEIAMPFFYPMSDDGGIIAEWDYRNWNIEILIRPRGTLLEVEAINLGTEQHVRVAIDQDDQQIVEQLTHLWRQMAGTTPWDPEEAKPEVISWKRPGG